MPRKRKPASGVRRYVFAQPAPVPERRPTGHATIPASGSRKKTYTFADPSAVRERVLRFEDTQSTVGPLGTEETGWHYDGEENNGPRWTCDYGCKSHVWLDGPAPWQYHAAECPYWQREGQRGRPLLRPTTRAPLSIPWRCPYGCAPFVQRDGRFAGQYHRYDCAWWNAEGSRETPFDGVA